MNNSLFKIAANYGAVCGLANFAFFLLLYYMGLNPLGAASWFGVWIPVLLICLAMRAVRDKLFSGYISYWQAVKAGVLTLIFSAFLFDMLIYLFGTVADASILAKHKEEMFLAMEQTKTILSDNLVERAMEEIDKTTMPQIAVSDFFNKLIGGAILSLIIAFFFQRSKPVIE